MTTEERVTAIEDNMRTLSAAMTSLAESQDKTEKAHAETEKALAALAESQAKTEKMVRGIGRYAMAIARDHEARIFGIENPPEPPL